MISARVRPNRPGFSLVEMLVAVGLFALISLIGITLLESILTTQRRTDDRLSRLGHLQTGLYLLTRDLQEAEPASLTLADGALVLIRRDLQGRQISISYRVVDHMLIRNIDSARRQPILTRVSLASWHFHLPNSGWRDDPQEHSHRFPDAVEIDMVTDDEGPLRRIVDLTASP